MRVREGRTKDGGCVYVCEKEKERGIERGRESYEEEREKGCARILGGDRTWPSFVAWSRFKEEGLRAGKAGWTRREKEKATGGERRYEIVACDACPRDEIRDEIGRDKLQRLASIRKRLL